MGTVYSQLEEPLMPPQQPICAIEPRFCLPVPVQLRLHEKLWSFTGEYCKIKDPTNGTVWFQCHGRTFSLRAKKVLRDHQGIPVANLKEKLISIMDKFTLYAGEGSERKICKLRCRLTFGKAKMYANFTDATGKSHCVIIKGDWRSKRCGVFYGEPKQGGQLVAKIYPTVSTRTFFLAVDDYIVEISPGVDCALIVMMCIALDEHARDQD